MLNNKARKVIDFNQEEEEFKKDYDRVSPKAVAPVSNQNDYTKKGINFSYLVSSNTSNYPWKVQQPQQAPTLKINGMTPTRINKNPHNPGNF